MVPEHRQPATRQNVGQNKWDIFSYTYSERSLAIWPTYFCKYILSMSLISGSMELGGRSRAQLLHQVSWLCYNLLCDSGPPVFWFQLPSVQRLMSFSCLMETEMLDCPFSACLQQAIQTAAGQWSSASTRSFCCWYRNSTSDPIISNVNSGLNHTA